MSRDIFEQMKYWATHSFPPVLDGVEVLNNSYMNVDPKIIADDWISHIGRALKYEEDLTEASKFAAEQGKLRIPIIGIDDYTTAESVLRGTFQTRREILSATQRAFTAIRDGNLPKEEDLKIAKGVANRYLSVLATELLP